MTRSVQKIKQPAFDLEAPLFGTGELARVSGLSRAMADAWVSEGRLKPTRREQSQRRIKGRLQKRQGRPRFSAIAIFTVKLTLAIRAQFGIGLSEWNTLGEEAEAAPFPADAMNIAELATYIAEGNWFWAVARGVENNKPFKIYCYATRSKNKWTFDTHIGDELKEPCFGLTEPFLFIPMWRIFSEVYVECKKLLGVTDQPTPGEDA